MKIKQLPENFLILHLNFRIAIRPSGTEPKLKFYIFGEGSPVAKVLKMKKIKYQLYQSIFGTQKRGRPKEKLKGLPDHPNQKVEGFSR